MKPFYTEKMLIECSTKEVQRLRTAVANEKERWSDRDEAGKLMFPENFNAYHKLYMDLTKILEKMPWDME